MLRGQTRSQRDIVHPAQWKIASVLGGWMRNGWTRGRVQRRPGIYDMRLTIYGRPVRVVGSEAWVAGESGVASRSAGSATAVHDAPVSSKSVRVLAEGHLPMLRFMLRGDELVRGCPRTIDDC